MGHVIHAQSASLNELIISYSLDNFMQEVTAPRSNCVLDTQKLEQYVEIRTAQEALEDALCKYDLLSIR